MHKYSVTLLLAMNFFALIPGASATVSGQITVSPQQIQLTGRMAANQLLLEANIDGKSVDLTRDAKYTASPDGLVEISATGFVRPLHDGQGIVKIEVQGEVISVPVAISQFTTPDAVDFERDVMI